uniref:HYC_CC_PP family protein n=1 Tax=Aquimarina pacifica TaxID=1296415 RepID=UPI0009DF89E9|nr:hypothetical protein [Aquimarina pacifica]
MSLIVFLSVLPFSIGMHYCGDTLVDTAIFSKVKTCGIEKAVSSTSGCSVTKKSCCSDKELMFEGQDELNTPFNQITIEHRFFIDSFYYVYIRSFEDVNNNVIPTEEYPPPLLYKEYYILNQTFLI